MPNFTVQDVFLKFGPNYIKNHKLSKDAWKVYNAIIKCHTKKLGIHSSTCEICGEEYFSFNSCRNRHCPMCQNYQKELWIQNESSYLLDCPYFHIVTTIPYELNEIILYNKRDCYNILFKATSESILKLANDPKWLGAKPGITSILHTWGSNMEFHPHIHSIVTGGGINNNKWINSPDNYLFKVQVLSSLFKGKFLAYLKSLDLHLPNHLKHLKKIKNLNKFLEPLYHKDWVTYIEPPKGNAENVIEYIGRYAFRICISNERIKDITDTSVTFEYKDYKDNGKFKLMTISGEEFIRRFLLHVLPKYFTKIKHYGLLANRSKKSIIKLCRILIGQRIFSDFSISIKKELHKFLCSSCKSSLSNSNFNFFRL